MTSLDPYSAHWISEGGKDNSGSVAWSDLHDEGNIHSLSRPSRLDQESDDLDSDVRQAFEEAKGRAQEREAFDRSRSSREELSSRYTDAKTGDLIASFVGWDSKFKTDPRSAADALASHYLRQPPNLLQPKTPEKADEAPADWRDDGKRQWALDNDVKRAWRAVTEAKNEDNEFKATAEHRQLLKQAFPGLNFDAALARIVQIDRDLLTDPLGAAGKLAASYGLPVTAGQHAAVEQEQKLGQAQQIVDHAVASGAMPDLNDPKVAAATEAVLRDRNFPSVDRGWTDLRNAYAIAVERVAAGQAPANTADPARLAEAQEACAWAQNNVPRYAELEPLVAEILGRPGMIPRSGVPSHDLGSAIELAGHLADRGHRTLGPPPAQIAAAATAAELKLDAALRDLGYQVTKPDREAATRARRASRSVSGSPTPGASAPRKDSGDDIWADARAAYHSASASI